MRQVPSGTRGCAEAKGVAQTQHNRNGRTAAEQSAWAEGYETAVRDAIALVEALAGPGHASLSAPVLLHVQSLLLELRSRREAA